MKKLCILIVALLMMSSFASAGFFDWITGKVTGPTIVGTACTADSECPAGQTCGLCPSGATCTSAKICLASAGTTPAAVADLDFPVGSSTIELCRYGLNRGIWRSSETSARSQSSNELIFANRDKYTFEATDIRTDGTLVMKVTKAEGAVTTFGPHSLTLNDGTGIVTAGPAGQEIKIRKHEGVLTHAYASSVGRHNGLCVSFDVAPTSWESTSLPFGTIMSDTNPTVWFKDDATGTRKLLFVTRYPGSSDDTTPIKMTVYGGLRVDTVLAQDVALTNGESKIINELWVKFDGVYRKGSKWVPIFYIADKNAQVTTAASAATLSLVAKTPIATVKQPGLIARLFGAKTVVAKPAATSTVEVAVPTRSVVAPSESPEVEASLPAASAEAMATAKCKTFMASELSYNPDHITGNQVCTKNDFGQCMVVLSETTTSYSYDKFNVGLQTHWSRLVNCDEDLISWSGEWEELKSPWNMFDKLVYVRDNNHSPAGGSVLCCK
ncbi:MAG: hypothetical protein WC852_02480 [Candidatus Nanoarchaeia archaeon]